MFNLHLRSTPHRLVFAQDGEDGFDRFRETKPDLVLAHVNAPRLDGTILCQLLRQEPGGSIPYLLMGEGLADVPGIHDRCAAVGADGILSLPVDRTTLITQIGRYLQGTPFRSDGETTREDEHPEVLTPVSLSQPTDIGPFESKTSIDFGSATIAQNVESDDMPTSLTIAPVELFSSKKASPDSDPGETTQNRTTTLPPVAARSNPPTMPLPVVQGQAQSQQLAFPDDTPEEWHSNGLSSDRRPILEEPELPVASMGQARPLGEGSNTRRLAHDAMLEEPQREITPSAEKSEPRADEAPQRKKAGLRKGLDESQLGKRLIRRVQRVYAVLDELDYYQLLGIDQNATPEQLKTAYFELSLEFHPDRFFLLRSGDIKEKIYAVFRRVTEAYGVLNDGRRRAAYDEGLSARKEKREIPELIAPPIPEANSREIRLDPPTQTPAAKRYVQLAQTALKAEDYDQARLFMAFAIAHEPSSAALRKALDDVSKRRARAQREAISSV